MASAILPIALAGVSAISGALGSRNRNNQAGSTTPTFDPRFSPLRDILLRNTIRGLNQGSALPAGYRSAGISNINSTAAGGAAALNANLTSRGLGTSNAAIPALAQNDVNRQASINQFENVTIPDEENRRRQDQINQAMGLLGMGRGSSSTMTGESGSEGGISGGLDGIAEMLGFLMANRRPGQPGTPLPSGQPAPNAPGGW